jgi:hypothetical protein
MSLERHFSRIGTSLRIPWGMALQEAVAYRVRSVCETGGNGHSAVADPTGLLAGYSTQPGQSGAGGAARGWSTHGGPARRTCPAGDPADPALYALGLLHRETYPVSQHDTALGGSTDAGKASATAKEQQAS